MTSVSGATALASIAASGFVGAISARQTTAEQSPTVKAKASVPSDTVDLSTVSGLLGEIEQQLQSSPSGQFNRVLSGAANDARMQAESERDPGQAQALESFAARLQVAANASGLSVLTTFTVLSLLED